jgi:hypothetical protein
MPCAVWAWRRTRSLRLDSASWRRCCTGMGIWWLCECGATTLTMSLARCVDMQTKKVRGANKRGAPGVCSAARRVTQPRTATAARPRRHCAVRGGQHLPCGSGRAGRHPVSSAVFFCPRASKALKPSSSLLLLLLLSSLALERTAQSRFSLVAGCHCNGALRNMGHGGITRTAARTTPARKTITVLENSLVQ